LEGVLDEKGIRDAGVKRDVDERLLYWLKMVKG
jgi:hypothetical protein